MAPFSNKRFISSLISVSCLPAKCTCLRGDDWVGAVTNSSLYPVLSVTPKDLKSTQPPFQSEKRPATILLESKATKKFWNEVPSKQHNVQEGLTCGVQEGMAGGVQEGQNKTPHKSMFLIEEKLSILSIIHISNWVTREMYMPLKKVFAKTPKAGWLATAKQNWEKGTSDPFSTLYCRSGRRIRSG